MSLSPTWAASGKLARRAILRWRLATARVFQLTLVTADQNIIDSKDVFILPAR
jgi:hypothetical protein